MKLKISKYCFNRVSSVIDSIRKENNDIGRNGEMEENKMEEIYLDFGQRLRKIRRSRNFRQATLCEILGISRPSLCNIEKGRQRIQLHLLYQLSSALEVPVTELVND